MLRPQLRTFIQAAGYGSDAQSVAAQNDALLLAFLLVSQRRPWSWLRTNTTSPTVTIGSAVLTGLPSNFGYPLALRLSTGGVTHEPLQEVLPLRIDDWLAQDTGTGEPLFWSLRNGQIVMYPRPDKAYTPSLDYVRSVATTEFDDDTDVLPWDPRFHPVLAWIAMSTLGLRQRDPTQYNIAKSEAESMLIEMEREDGRLESHQKSVKQWPGWDWMR